MNQFLTETNVLDRETYSFDDLEGTFYDPGQFYQSTYRVVETESYLTTMTLATNTTGVIKFTLQTNQAKTLPVLATSIYADNDENAAYLWPNGASLSNEIRGRHEWQLSWAETDPTTGTYVWKVRHHNEGANSHTYYIRLKAYFLYLAKGGSTATQTV